ncbi:MAG: DUF192 domain-containing protein [Litoreibacter sp.]|nr:DUF192 domain-containing protein [Litoreibacter sp.]
MPSTTIKRVSLAGIVWASSVVGALAACSATHVDLRGGWGKARFKVEIADDAAERAQGLMHRESMPRMSGMLFIYEAPQPLAFWMRNTLIPLDMIFLDETGTVAHIHENAVPLDETPISGGPGPLLSVLEINGGMASRLGISIGSQLRHPGLPQDGAAWPCDD